MRVLLISAVLLTLLDSRGECKEPAAEETLQVTARLVKIPGKLPPDDLYDYAYVMRYEVVGGKLDKKTLLVAHYKPLRPRKAITDKMKKHVSGTLEKFKEGELHQLTLTGKVRSVFKGAMVDEFFAADRASPRYFCLRVDPAKGK